jgi:hypothetical protein
LMNIFNYFVQKTLPSRRPVARGPGFVLT